MQRLLRRCSHESQISRRAWYCSRVTVLQPSATKSASDRARFQACRAKLGIFWFGAAAPLAWLLPLVADSVEATSAVAAGCSWPGGGAVGGSLVIAWSPFSAPCLFSVWFGIVSLLGGKAALSRHLVNPQKKSPLPETSPKKRFQQRALSIPGYLRPARLDTLSVCQVVIRYARSLARGKKDFPIIIGTRSKESIGSGLP